MGMQLYYQIIRPTDRVRDHPRKYNSTCVKLIEDDLWCFRKFEMTPETKANGPIYKLNSPEQQVEKMGEQL